MNKIYKVGLIGCGHINETYFKAHEYFNNFKIINNNLNFLIAYKNQINDFIIGVYNSKQESTPLIFPGPIFPIIF